MELTQLLLTGSLSGLVSVLAHSTLWSAIGLLRGGRTITRAEPSIAEAVLHMGCGIALALLFWLSWGLAAVVDSRWWIRGLSFGGLTWIALVLPSLTSLALTRAIDARAAALIGSRWATTTLVVGLACAWSWQQQI
jgi:hypothetical protein